MSRIRRHTYSPLILYCVFGLFLACSIKGQTFILKIQTDDKFDLYIDGINKASGPGNTPIVMVNGIHTTTKVIAVAGVNRGGSHGIGVDSEHIYTKVGRFGWKCIKRNDLLPAIPKPETDLAWTTVGYNDTWWPDAREGGNLHSLVVRNGGTSIWAESNAGAPFCRGYLDECRSSPCINEGTCVDGADAFMCMCQPGWAGVTCGSDINECGTGSICNSGQCTNNPGSFTCDCDGSGYEGFLCETEVDECNNTETPSCGFGRCTNSPGNFSCDCTNTGYEGSFCETLIGDVPKKFSIAVIAGAVVAAVVVAVVIALVIFLLIKRRKRKSESTPKQGSVNISFANIDEPNNSSVYVNSATAKDVSSNMMKAQSPGDGKPDLYSKPKKGPTITPDKSPAGEVYYNISDIGHGVLTRGQLLDFAGEFKQYTQKFENEYKDIPSEPLYSIEDGEKNLVLNRFKNIFAYDKNRVVLEDSSFSSDYINATYITRLNEETTSFIASQGCLPDTISQFWSMIWQLESKLIVMLTNFVETGKNKCAPYYPQVINVKQTYGSYSVRLVSKEIFGTHIISVVALEKEGDAERRVTHAHFTVWPDKEVPPYTYEILEFRKKVRSLCKDSSCVPVVHCSAGVGRTGTYIAVDMLLDQLDQEKQVDVLTTVKHLRDQRMKMVQVQGQYTFLYHTLCEYVRCGETSIKNEDLGSTHDEMSKGGPNGKTALQQQYELLEELNEENKPAKPLKSHEASGLNAANKGKTRGGSVYVPEDMKRPLISPSDGGTDYINAVFVGGFFNQRQYIATQSPLTNTINDLWKLVSEFNVKVIIALNQFDEEDCPIYWPQEVDQCCFYGHVSVTLKSTETSHLKSFTERVLEMKDSSVNPPDCRLVHHYQLYGLPEAPVPPAELIPGIIELTSKLAEDRDYNDQQTPVLIHCKNGVSHSGLFSALLNLFDQMRTQNEVDVFTAVRYVRRGRHQFICSLEQYNFLYKVLVGHQVQFQLYANFT